MIKRLDDKPSVMKRRIKEYEEKTEPVIKKMKKQGFAVIKIDGTPPPFEVFKKIARRLR